MIEVVNVIKRCVRFVRLRMTINRCLKYKRKYFEYMELVNARYSEFCKQYPDSPLNE